MSKLLRIENTNMFLVVSEDEFIKKMRIEAIVRIEENSHDDSIRRYEPQTPNWHEELEVLKNIKRKELYPSEKIYVDLKILLIHYFCHSKNFYIRVCDVFGLADLVYKSLLASGMIDNYISSLYLNLEEFERVLLKSKNIFVLSDEKLKMNSVIFCSDPVIKTKQFAEQYPVDETLTNIMKVFVEKTD